MDVRLRLHERSAPSGEAGIINTFAARGAPFRQAVAGANQHLDTGRLVMGRGSFRQYDIELPCNCPAACDDYQSNTR